VKLRQATDNGNNAMFEILRGARFGGTHARKPHFGWADLRSPLIKSPGLRVTNKTSVQVLRRVARNENKILSQQRTI
jgi:hypothetical protein